jgi:hypothetical protein
MTHTTTTSTKGMLKVSFSGSFLSTLPLGFAAGDENIRRYVGDNPVNATDPSGLADEFEFDDGTIRVKVNHKNHRVYLQNQGALPFAYLDSKPSVIVKATNQATEGATVVVGVNGSKDFLSSVRFYQFEALQLSVGKPGKQLQPIPAAAGSKISVQHPDSGWDVNFGGSWIPDNKKGQSLTYPGTIITLPTQKPADPTAKFMLDSSTTAKVLYNLVRKKGLYPKEDSLQVQVKYLVLIQQNNKIVANVQYQSFYGSRQ